MSITNTTLASAMAVTDSKVVLAASTGVSAGYIIEIDGEIMQVANDYTVAKYGVNVPVLRAQDGTVADKVRPSGAKVRVGAASDEQWGSPSPQTTVRFPIATPARERVSYSATGAIALPSAGNDLDVYINGTTICAMTIADPVGVQDGSRMTIITNGAAAHTFTFASGLSGAGGSYDVITVNATAPVVLGPFIAVNAKWQAPVAVPMAGTVTNVTATVA